MNTMNERNAASDAMEQGQRTLEQARDAGQRAMERAGDLGRQAWDEGSRPQRSRKPDTGRPCCPHDRAADGQTALARIHVGGLSGAIGTSLVLQFAGKEDKANFVGQWAPTLLILGLYNKMVKLMGSDAS